MDLKGKNMASVKQSNILLITSYIHKYGPSSRKTIADVIGISQAGVGKICKELIDIGLLHEQGAKDTNYVGRREVLLDLNYNKFYFVGINLLNDGIVTIASHINGKKVKRYKSEYKKTDICKQTVDIIEDVMKDLNIKKEYVMGIGISSRGETDPIKGKIILENGEDISIVKYIEEKLDIKTYINNNVRNLMIQEMRKLDSRRNSILIKWGPGLGASIYINGSIVNGADLKAGEIGKIVIKHENNKKVTLEDIFSTEQIIKEVMSNFNKSIMPILSSKVNTKEDIDIDVITEVLNCKGKDYTKEIIMDKVEILLKYISIIDNVIDFKNIVLYGKVFEQEVFFGSMQEIISEKYKSLEGKVKKSTLSQESEYCSPIYLAMSKMFD